MNQHYRRGAKRQRFLLVAWAGFALAAPAAAQTRIPLKVEMGDVSINKIPFLVALDEGLYAKHGLEVDMVPFSASAAARTPSVTAFTSASGGA